MKPSLPLLLLPLLLSSCSPTPNRASDIKVADAWARATLPGTTASAAYLTITNRGTSDDALIAVAASSGPADLHSTSMAGGIMQMRQLDRLAVPAGATVKLEAGDTHLMLTELRQPLAAGGRIALSLRFDKSAERKVVAQVRGSGAPL